MEIVDELRHATESARALLKTYEEIIGDDAEVAAATVEGETNLHDVIARAAGRVVELNSLIDGTDALRLKIVARINRLEKQKEHLKTLIAAAMEIAEVRKLELPICTLSIRATPPAVVVTDESAVPSDYWSPQPPKLDKRRLLADLKQTGAPIPGAQLSNGGSTLNFSLS
jgi:hypothetical protein